jgi:hypothetical protein
LPEQITTETSFEERVKQVVYNTLKDVIALPEELRSWIPYWVEQYGIAVPRSQVIGNYTTAESISDAGEAAHGRTVAIRAGSSPYEFIQMTYDGTYGKWVSSQIWSIVEETSGNWTDASWTLAPAFVPIFIPNFKALYDAGLRPQVFVSSKLRISSGAGTAEVRGRFYEVSDGDTAENAIASTSSVSNTTGTLTYKMSGWTDPTFASPPADTHCYLRAERQVSGGATANRSDLTLALRWVASPA